MRRLIINADDFGLTQGCNEGIIESMKNGVVSSTTLMMNMPHVVHAVELAKENNITSLGIHLTLTCGKPILAKEEVPSLVDESGNFYKRSKYLLPVMKLEEVEKELRAQIHQFLQMGIEPSHFDGHHHIHMYEGIREIVMDLAREFNVPLRHSNEEIKEMYKQIGIATTDYFTWNFYGEEATMENLKELITTCREGTMEIMTHPAYVDEELIRVSSYNDFRRNEMNILTDKNLKEWLIGQNIQLISFNDLKD